MSARSEGLGDQPIRGEEALRMPGRLAPLHAPLPLAGRLVRVLCAVVEIAVLSMFHPRQDFWLRGAVALQFIPHSIGFSGGRPLPFAIPLKLWRYYSILGHQLH